ncbi:MAG: DUF1501 domain-containing protein [Candidatus Kapabacteria bacterium]|nr:DUF1501 domain-containing protein [Candidatus Kapabacteria bacterium]
MNRRDFLRRSSAAGLLPIVMNGYGVRAYANSPLLEAVAAAGCEDRVLVLVQLQGGNDGLNTVIPLDQYGAYQSVRGNIAIAEAQALKLTEAVGLHPQMAAVQTMFKNGQIRLVQSVGYPVPNYSHFRSTDIWLSGSDSEEVISTGWLGRFLEHEYPGFPDGYPNATMPDPLAIQIGSVISMGLEGHAANMGMAFTDPTSYYNINNGNTAPGVGARAGQELTFIRKVGQQIERFATPVKNAASRATNKSGKYPAAKTNPLADQLKIVAQLIAGGLKTRVYVVSLSGFDTHSYQVSGGAGSPVPHGTLLNQVSVAIDAFQDDLRLLGVQDRVMGMTFSEFGRRIRSNGSGGTDHGAAAPIFLFGTNVVSGVLGANPTIDTAVGPEDNLPMQFDFRSVYATLLKDWFCVPPDTVRELLYRDFPLLALIKGGSPTSVSDAVLDATTSLSVVPNPIHDIGRVQFICAPGPIRLSLFDATGREVAVMAEGSGNGSGDVLLRASTLPAGIYHVRLQDARSVRMTQVAVVR